MGTTPTIATIPGHDEVCSCNRCILSRVTIREDRRQAERRATVRPTPDRRQAPQLRMREFGTGWTELAKDR